MRFFARRANSCKLKPVFWANQYGIHCWALFMQLKIAFAFESPLKSNGSFTEEPYITPAMILKIPRNAKLIGQGHARQRTNFL